MYKLEKTQGLQRMGLFIVEVLANVLLYTVPMNINGYVPPLIILRREEFNMQKSFYFMTYLSSHCVAFGWPCWPRHRSGWVCLGTGDFLLPQWAISPVFLPTLGGLGLLPGAPIKGNANGAEGTFGNAGHVWTTALRLDPP